MRFVYMERNTARDSEVVERRGEGGTGVVYWERDLENRIGRTLGPGRACCQILRRNSEGRVWKRGKLSKLAILDILLWCCV